MFASSAGQAVAAPACVATRDRRTILRTRQQQKKMLLGAGPRRRDARVLVPCAGPTVIRTGRSIHASRRRVERGRTVSTGRTNTRGFRRGRSVVVGARGTRRSSRGKRSNQWTRRTRGNQRRRHRFHRPAAVSRGRRGAPGVRVPPWRRPRRQGSRAPTAAARVDGADRRARARARLAQSDANRCAAARAHRLARDRAISRAMHPARRRGRVARGVRRVQGVDTLQARRRSRILRR